MLIRRETHTGADDLITVYRPCTVDEMIGQEANKKIIKNNLSKGTTPHGWLFTGPAGCGKTTAARIIALGLNCESSETSTDAPCLKCQSCQTILNHSNLDVIEVNVGETGGKGDASKITEDLSFSPSMSKYKVLIFDEAHKLTAAAQDLLLKKVEDGYKHVYFIFCTNQPEKLNEAFLTRTINMHFGVLSQELIAGLLMNICDFEGVAYNQEVLDVIIDASKGVPRVAISNLKQVMDEGSWDTQNVKLILTSQQVDEEDPNIMDIGKALMSGSFKSALTVLSKPKVKNIPEETIRIAVAGFFTARLKWSKVLAQADKISASLDVLTTPILYAGKPAHHTLVNYFYKVSRIMKG